MATPLFDSSHVLRSNLQSVRYIVSVAAGKGGVGKSSTTVNLALTFQKMGYEVGVLDADLYGPSIGKMMPLETEMQVFEGRIVPGMFKGVKVFSLAYLKREAMLVRAPVVNGLIQQCLEQISWGELDYLFVDFPPGTGDIQLSLMQAVPFSGAILVTTPQDISALDVEKTAYMFEVMGVNILGVVENMSYFVDPISKGKHFLFGSGAAEKISEQFSVRLLGKIPVDPEVSRSADLGMAFPLEFPQSAVASELQNIASQARDLLFEREEMEKVCLKQFEYEWKEME